MRSFWGAAFGADRAMRKLCRWHPYREWDQIPGMARLGRPPERGHWADIALLIYRLDERTGDSALMERHHAPDTHCWVDTRFWIPILVTAHDLCALKGLLRKCGQTNGHDIERLRVSK